LPESAVDAHLCVYDLNGQQIRSTKLLERGAQTETFKHNDLKAGIYLYSLLVDGKEIDCKRMVITE